MITSDNPFDRLMFEHQHQDDYHLQHSSYNQQQEMGPWSPHLDLKKIYHSIQISAASCKKPLKKQLKDYGRRRYQSKQILKKKIFQQIQQKCSIEQSQPTDVVIFQKQNGSPQLKRLTHLPVISAREQYGDIFKYTKPIQSDHQSSTRSLPKTNKIYRLEEELTAFSNKKTRSKLGQKVSPEKDRISIVSSIAQCKQSAVSQIKNPQYLPSIDKFLNRNVYYDIYERCVVRKQKNLREREKSVQYRLL